MKEHSRCRAFLFTMKTRRTRSSYRSHAPETVKVFVLEQKQKPSPRRHEGHEVFNALSLINYFFFVNFVS
ncbi:MAG: hypothetical protein QX203_06055, partial [Methylococcaceae bacterium]